MKTKVSRLLSLVLILGVLSVASGETWTSAPFGAANGFNLFVINDLDHHYTDVQGRVAVGGVAKFDHYRLAWKATCPPIQNILKVENCSLVVGKELHRGYGTFHGVAAYEGLYNYPPPEYGKVTGGVYKRRLIDFPAAAAHLRDLSSKLSKRKGNGGVLTAKNPPPARDAILMKGEDAVLNVFLVRGAELAKASYIKIEAPAQSTVLVNVDGKVAEMRSFGFDIVGVKRERVLFNFFEAESLALSNIGFQGSILAPYAKVDFQNGNIDGALIVDSLVGNGEVHLHLFEGSVPYCDCP